MKFDPVVTEPRQTGAIFIGTLGKRCLIVVPNEKKTIRYVQVTHMQKKKKNIFTNLRLIYAAPFAPTLRRVLLS